MTLVGLCDKIPVCNAKRVDRDAHLLYKPLTDLILTGPALMIPAGFLFLLLFTDGESSERNCTYLDVLKHLNLTENKEQFAMIRPVKNYKEPTKVTLDVLLYAILNVVKKDQQLVPYVWIDMWWKNEFISWDPDQFCGIRNFSLPTALLWKPDITIEEMTEKDRSPPNPFLIIHSHGEIEITDDQVLVSSCRMHLYKFPFDTQTCNLSFKSVVHTDNEIQLVPDLDSSEIVERTRKLMHNQYEWLFDNMTVHKKNVNNFDFSQSVVIYTISIKRRPALYIVNFMLPILFFLGLDLASFLISDSSGEKLGFKVTVLLAVTVMQLILNEMLPSSSDRIPLIASYCIGMFSLMMLSLLETLLVMYLLHIDAKTEAEKEQSLSEDCGFKRGNVSIKNYYRGQTPSELLPVAKEESSSQLTEESHDFEKLSDELREVVNVLSLLLNSRDEEVEPGGGYLKRVCKRINKGFFIFYIVSITLFLVYMFFRWNAQ
ncbi:5-hydroxytryptamine receptor 3A-like [Pagrus major]|uniref:5-hydroxytryptamine receptor 3A-like n=1 Tax=Pagrus major TaxID=143350 RepID=UPI003CC84343